MISCPKGLCEVQERMEWKSKDESKFFPAGSANESWPQLQPSHSCPPWSCQGCRRERGNSWTATDPAHPSSGVGILTFTATRENKPSCFQRHKSPSVSSPGHKWNILFFFFLLLRAAEEVSPWLPKLIHGMRGKHQPQWNSEIKQLCHQALKAPEVVCHAYLVFLNNSNFLSPGCLLISQINSNFSMQN